MRNLVSASAVSFGRVLTWSWSSKSFMYLTCCFTDWVRSLFKRVIFSGGNLLSTIWWKYLLGTTGKHLAREMKQSFIPKWKAGIRSGICSVSWPWGKNRRLDSAGPPRVSVAFASIACTSARSWLASPSSWSAWWRTGICEFRRDLASMAEGKCLLSGHLQVFGIVNELRSCLNVYLTACELPVPFCWFLHCARRRFSNASNTGSFRILCRGHIKVQL